MVGRDGVFETDWPTKVEDIIVDGGHLILIALHWDACFSFRLNLMTWFLYYVCLIAVGASHSFLSPGRVS